MRFEIDGPFKPYVRMTQKGKWVRPEAQEYLASKDALAAQFQIQMAGRWVHIERGTPLGVSIIIEHSKKFHRCDLDNEVKAILDSMQGVVFDDDRWVDYIEASRWLSDKDRILVSVLPIKETT